MVTRVKFWLPVLALAAALLASGVTPGAARTWREYRTDNFILYSDTSEKHGRQLVEDLEYFRHYLGQAASINNTTAPLPLTIIAFKNGSDFNKEFNSEGLTGFYIDRPSGAFAFANITNDYKYLGQTGRQVLYHEYVHYFLRQFSSYRYPRWYHEGFADYMSGFSRDSDSIEIGKIIEARFKALKSNDWQHRFGIFSYVKEWPPDLGLYARAWITVHFLQDSEERKRQLEQYILALNLGKPNEVAFEQAFGLKMEQMQADVWNYWTNRQFEAKRQDINRLDISPTVEIHDLPRNEVLLFLARVHLILGKNRHGLKRIGKHLKKILSSEPDNLEASEVQILASIRTEQLELAQSQLEVFSGTETAPRGRINYLKGQLFLARARGVQRGNPFIEYCQLAAQSFAEALEYSPDDPEILYLYGFSSNLGQTTDTLTPLKALLKARNLLPQNEQIEQAYAVAALRGGYAKQASEIFQDYLDWSSDRSTKVWAAQNLLAAYAELGIEVDPKQLYYRKD